MTTIDTRRLSAVRLAGNCAVALSVLSLASGACSDSTAEKIKAAALTGSCSINSDCQDPFVCAFTRCHIACTEDRDCAVPQRCVKGDQGQPVCQLPDETKCERDKDCQGDQVCAADLECHDTCKSGKDCVGDQLCLKTGECASSDGKRDELDASGNLVVASSSDAGSAGAGGSNGAGGSGGGNAGNAGGSSGDGGPPGTGGTSIGQDASIDGGGNADSGGAAGKDGGAAGHSGDGAIVADFVEPGDVEVVDNDTYQTAIVAKKTASIYTNGSDRDWFSVRAPDGPGAYVITLDVDQQAAARVYVNAYDGVNRDPMGGTSTNTGALAHLFITVRAGTTTFIEIVPFTNQMGPHRLDLTFTLTPENDANEPNDTKEAATPIATNSDVAAQCMQAHVTASDSKSDDWYKVALVAGTATVKLVKDFQPGPRITIGWAPAAGTAETLLVTTPASVDSWSFKVPSDGTYYIHIRHFGSSVPFVATGNVPEYVKAQYVFQVQQ